jgi:hypothetical protein
MLSRSHVAPFLRVERGRIRVCYLADVDGRVVPFLNRLCRLVQRLEEWPRDRVVEALRRQERRVRDASRMAGIAKTLLDLCAFEPVAGTDQAPEIRDAVFRARGVRWPPARNTASRISGAWRPAGAVRGRRRRAREDD